jgi:uncharacterized integral membrane protein
MVAEESDASTIFGNRSDTPENRWGLPIKGYHDIEQKLQRLELHAIFFIFATICILLLMATSVWISFDFAAGLRMLSLSAVVAISAAAVGAALGFLFGIPRVLQNSSVGRRLHSTSSANTFIKSASAGSLFATNTSLEEISDWLTKIIIGLSLIRFHEIIRYVEAAASRSASYVDSVQIGGPPLASFTSGCFFAIILASTLLSCLYFYLQTRTRITVLFQETEAHMRSGVSSKVIDDVLTSPIVATMSGETSAQANPLTPNDMKLLSAGRAEFVTAREIAAWASALARKNDYQGAELALLNAVQLEPGNVDILMRLAEVRRLNNALGFVDTVINLLQKAKGRSAVVDMGQEAQLEALYLNPPRGFRKAIEVSDLLVGTRFEKDPHYHLRRACAFGQMYSFEKRTSAPDNQVVLKNAQNEALKSLKKVIDMVPDPQAPVRQELRRLLHDTETIDDDFKDLRQLPEFQALP